MYVFIYLITGTVQTNILQLSIKQSINQNDYAR